jgi:hypothetical protein
MGRPEELLFPALAAEALGVSPATLRRYAQAWGKAFGPLPRAPGGGRLWPHPALARLKAARELAQREGLPLEEALLRVEGEAPLVATARPEEAALVEVLGVTPTATPLFGASRGPFFGKSPALERPISVPDERKGREIGGSLSPFTLPTHPTSRIQTGPPRQGRAPAGAASPALRGPRPGP